MDRLRRRSAVEPNRLLQKLFLPRAVRQIPAPRLPLHRQIRLDLFPPRRLVDRKSPARVHRRADYSAEELSRRDAEFAGTDAEKIQIRFSLLRVCLCVLSVSAAHFFFPAEAQALPTLRRKPLL